MTRRLASYITKTKHGVYYFQIRISPCEASKLGVNPPLYRKSLNTKDRSQAIYLARRYWLQIDRIFQMGEKIAKEKSNKSMEEFLRDQEESQNDELERSILVLSE